MLLHMHLVQARIAQQTRARGLIRRAIDVEQAGILTSIDKVINRLFYPATRWQRSDSTRRRLDDCPRSRSDQSDEVLVETS